MRAGDWGPAKYSITASRTSEARGTPRRAARSVSSRYASLDKRMFVVVYRDIAVPLYHYSLTLTTGHRAFIPREAQNIQAQTATAAIAATTSPTSAAGTA